MIELINNFDPTRSKKVSTHDVSELVKIIDYENEHLSGLLAKIEAGIPDQSKALARRVVKLSYDIKLADNNTDVKIIIRGLLLVNNFNQIQYFHKCYSQEPDPLKHIKGLFIEAKKIQRAYETI